MSKDDLDPEEMLHTAIWIARFLIVVLLVGAVIMVVKAGLWGNAVTMVAISAFVGIQIRFLRVQWRMAAGPRTEPGEKKP